MRVDIKRKPDRRRTRMEVAPPDRDAVADWPPDDWLADAAGVYGEVARRHLPPVTSRGRSPSTPARKAHRARRGEPPTRRR
jgi:hypothetical protein